MLKRKGVFNCIVVCVWGEGGVEGEGRVGKKKQKRKKKEKKRKKKEKK
jgi:hypothetical protein